MLKLIVAVNEKGVIGKNQKMPWHCPADLQHFKRTTLNQNVVMGRKTVAGLPGKLPQRTLYTVSKSTSGPYIINDFQAFLEREKDSETVYYIAGGAEIYRQALPYVQELLISKIPNQEAGDTHFPNFDKNAYTVNISEHDGFTLYHYVRKETK